MSTYETAKQIVKNIKTCLDNLGQVQFPSVRSIFLTGSFVRGDWLDSSSDLDVNILYKEGASSATFEADVTSLKACLRAKGVLATFPSQCPGGIDWSFQPFVPESSADVAQPTPYAPYGTFYFDLLTHISILWGENFLSALPPVNNTRELVLPTLEQTWERLKSLPDNPVDRQRSAFTTYKAAVMLQLFFGELTLDKFRMLELYQRYVPDFILKERGEHIIQERLSARYPQRPPKFLEPRYYSTFVESAIDLMVHDAN